MKTGLGRVIAQCGATMRSIWMAGCIAVLAAGVAHAQNFAFSSFNIEGNQRVADGTILTFGGLQPGAGLSTAELNTAGQNIRESGLFESVDLVPQGSTLLIRVVEYPTINRINIEGNSRLRDAQLLTLVQSQSRRVFTPEQAEADTAAITQAYAEQGRINATVTPRIIPLSDNRVDLVFEVVESAITEIERITFVGNRTFSEGRLRRVLETKEAGIFRALVGRDTFSSQRVAQDREVLTDFYRSRGFIDFVIQNVDVSLTRERDAYLVTYNVREGQRYSIADVTVTSEINGVNAAEFEEAVRLRSGSTYSPVSVDNDITRIERLAVQRGIRFVQAEAQISRNPRDLSLNVNYVLVPGERVFIERIDIEGNGTTLDRVIRNQFRSVEGDPLNPREVQESARRIRALGFFQGVNVDTRAGTSANQRIIDVDVEEGPTGTLSFGANFNTDTGASLLASYSQSNFQGRGQGLDFSFSTAESNRSVGFSFTEPQLLGRDLRGSINLSYSTTDNENALYDTETLRISPAMSFPVSELGRLSLFYALEYNDLFDVSSSASEVISQEAELGGIWTNSLGYTYSFDNRRTGLNPDVGLVFRFGQEFGFGDTQFIKTTALAGAETDVLNEEVTLRATWEGGLLSYQKGNSRVTDRFFLGSRLMRGFEAGGIGPRDADTDDALGGDAFSVVRLEAEFPLGLPSEYGISGGAFIDYGSVWDVGETFGEDVVSNDFIGRSVAGLSIFWTTPIGPLRFNFTEPLDVQDVDETRNFDVTISTSF
ncbi:Beta-barrel assembly machine subunit BamA [Yoonia maricola]|uniref:Outer membrane protein assembly factor BamA n=1 Tax=Yoonia maricola TaxID=420999 RepID=A0A2M8WM03_9RHOB|nr:outer membrane protein assembly factor BamA [Yoonia maricola]PJI91949.1 Beta-barrel assembly machine subunit BamA [Yoonia maricola]